MLIEIAVTILIAAAAAYIMYRNIKNSAAGKCSSCEYCSNCPACCEKKH